MTAAVATWWSPPPAPLDVWADVRAQAPDTDDHHARHRRGFVRLPWEINPDPGEREGDMAEAWVCCDVACAGVELGEHDLERNHGCCTPRRYVSDKPWKPARRHTVGLGTVDFPGYYHGEYTPYWQPEQA